MTYVAQPDPLGLAHAVLTAEDYLGHDDFVVGVYLFSGNIMDACHAINPSPRGELEITDAIQWLIDDGQQVAERTITGWWKDTGKLYDMLEATGSCWTPMSSVSTGHFDPTSWPSP
ncbi:MAG: sugar phosphate nucleotidyltransferase [Euzebya sp.]